MSVSVSYEKLWQTKLDSVGGVNSITFFLLHISESDSAQVLRPIKWTDIERDVHARLNIYMCSADACLTGMSVNL